MLAIRMQRRGRKGHAQFRVIVQESRLSPKSGRVVAHVGSYDPHSKLVTLDTEKIDYYLSNGAQPSNTVAKLLDREKVSLPDWVNIERTQTRKLRHDEKLRKNQPAAEVAAPEEAPAEEPVTEEEAPAEEAPVEEAPAEEEKVEEKAEEKPAKETPADEPAKDDAKKEDK